MELDDLKNTWQNKNNGAEQQNLTTLIIDKMTQEKYHSKINKITYPEFIGSCICLIALGFILLNFTKFDTIILRSIAAIAMVVLLAISILSILSLQKLRIKKVFDTTYTETLKTLTTQKIAFYKLQKTNLLLCYLLMVTIIILLPKLFGNKDITQYKYFWLFTFTTGYSFLFLFSKFVSRYYNKTLKQSEELFQELHA